ncbi:MAG: cupin domain-containing protein [Hyphomonadaceae bacterium]
MAEDIATRLRRVVTANDADGKSFILLDGGPVAQGVLLDIWQEATTGALDSTAQEDLRPTRVTMALPSNNMKVRWVRLTPPPEGVSPEALRTATRARFAELDGLDHLADQSRHPGMHKTATLDVICVLEGEILLTMDKGETRLKPGDVVIQRGTSHGWTPIGGPALMLAVMIERPLKK